MASGSYSLTAVATDNHSLQTTSGAVNILVDTPPTCQHHQSDEQRHLPDGVQHPHHRHGVG